MLIEAVENDSSNEFDEVDTFLADFLGEPDDEEDTSEFDAWVCGLLDLYDDNN